MPDTSSESSGAGDGTLGDRRPIAARQLRISQRMADALVRAKVSPNAVSLAGMACGIGAGIAFALTPRTEAWRLLFALGAILVPLRLLANMLDGMVAIASGTSTKVGELYNEVPDRISDIATLVGLGLARGGHPFWGFAAALAAVMTAYVRAAIKVAGGAQDYSGPLAKQQRMALVIVASTLCAVLPVDWQVGKDGRGIAAIACFLVFAGSVLTFGRRLHRAGRSFS